MLDMHVEKQGFDEMLMNSGCFPFKRRISFIVIILGVLQVVKGEGKPSSEPVRRGTKRSQPGLWSLQQSSGQGHVLATAGDTHTSKTRWGGGEGETHLVILPHVDRGGRVLPGARLAGHPLPGVVGRGERPRGVGGGVLAWLCGELAVWSVLLVSIVGLWQQKKREPVSVWELSPWLGCQDRPPLSSAVPAVSHPQNPSPPGKGGGADELGVLLARTRGDITFCPSGPEPSFSKHRAL